MVSIILKGLSITEFNKRRNHINAEQCHHTKWEYVGEMTEYKKNITNILFKTQ